MAFTVEVGGTDRTDKWQRFKSTGWEDPLNGRGTGRITFRDAVGGFFPTDGETVEIIEDGTVRFGGILMEPQMTEPEGTGILFFDCQMADYNILADRRLVGENFDDVAADLIVSGIVTNHMTGEGISLAGVEVSAAVTASFPNVKATEAFNQLSDATGRAWWIDENKVMNFKARDSVAAPADLNGGPGGTLLAGTVSVRGDRQKYRNQQVVRAGTEEFPILAVSGDLTEQAARAAIEGTSGIYAQLVEQPEILNSDVAMEFAADLLERFNEITQVVAGKTRTPGFRAGQAVNVDLPNFGINNVEMLIDSVTAEMVTVDHATGTQELWYSVRAITGDPFGGWMEHFRKAPPINGPLRFQNDPGLFRVDPTPGVVIHDPLPDGLLWYQGSASGVLDSSPSAAAITNNQISNGGSGTDSNFMVTIRRGPVASPRQSIVEKWIVDANEIVITSPNMSLTWDELFTSSFKGNLILSPDNTYAAFVERDAGSDPVFGVVNIAGLGFLGSVTMTGGGDNNTPTEGAWAGDYVFWPAGSGSDIYVFDVSIPTAPALDNTFTTSLTNVEALALSPDRLTLYATGGGSNLVVAIDITDPTAPSEDDTQVLTRSYQSLGISEDGAYMAMCVRADSSNVGYAILSLSGTTMTLETEATRPLSNSIMDGAATIFSNNSVITARQRTPNGVNTQELHVFDFDETTKTLALRETLSYNHSSAGNSATAKASANDRILSVFGFNTDAQVTYGRVQYNTAVPLTIDNPLRVGFGGTGLDTFAPGDIVYADRSLPDDNRGHGNLTRLAIGDETQYLIVSGGFPVWSDLVVPQAALTEDLDMAGFSFDNAPALRGYIDGLELATAADADHDVTVRPGACADVMVGNDRMLVLGAGLTKQIDAAWVEGDDVGGFAPVGVVSGELPYEWFVIEETATPGNLDVMIDDNVAAANVPSGWVANRRIGTRYTDASANILPMSQVGDESWFDDPVQDELLTSGTLAGYQTVSLMAPADGIWHGHMRAEVDATSLAEGRMRSTGQSGASAVIQLSASSEVTRSVGGMIRHPVDASRQVEVTMQGAGSAPAWSELELTAFGWKDGRGRDDDS